MKKCLLVAAVAALLAIPASAIDSLVVKNATNGTVFGVAYETGVATVTVAGAVSATTISGDALASPAATVGTATVTQRLVCGVTEQTLTNAATISAATPVVIVTTAVASNDVVLPKATSAGQVLSVIASPSLTNVLVILDTAQTAGDITLGANDSISLIANSASNFVEISRSNN